MQRILHSRPLRPLLFASQRSLFSTAQAGIPNFVRHRLDVWDKAAQLDKQPESKPITITLLDGKTVEGVSGVSTPLAIAKGIRRSLADEAIVAKVNGQLWDMNRPLTGPSKIEFLTFEHTEGKETFWHSSAHILGQAMEQLYGEGSLLAEGPPTENGFFYDIFLPDGRVVAHEDHAALNKLAKEIVSAKQPAQRIEVSREVALEMFAYSKFKQEIIRSIPEGEPITLYRSGNFVDLCRGPHLPHTGLAKALSVYKSSGVYWKGNAKLDTLQRVYAISFPSASMLADWEKAREEAAKRDHRVIGKAQDLFMFHPWSPGSAFFMPHGARIFNKLVTFLRAEYRRRGYEEVLSPLMYNKQLWMVSGHWENYKENMYLIHEGCPSHSHEHGHEHGHEHNHGVEGEEFGLKPMNCPGHCLMFGSKKRSYRELPIRWADFSALHRNEASGTLTGLTRVRRFHQDDSHIFCTEDQVLNEISNCLDFLRSVYSIFGFKFAVRLSTRPEKYMGSLEMWDRAESALIEALGKQFGEDGYTLNPQDGAFYGPKIDVAVTDAVGRQHQCATIQLDFQLPRRFGLTYVAEDGTEQVPVMLHRAILGSVERMIAILTEHFAGKWPFWMSPRQVIVASVNSGSSEYAKRVAASIHEAGFHVDLDISDKTLPKKVREAQLSQYNFILVVGDNEAQAGSVNVRTRDNQVHGTKPLSQVIEELKHLSDTFQ